MSVRFISAPHPDGSPRRRTGVAVCRRNAERSGSGLRPQPDPRTRGGRDRAVQPLLAARDRGHDQRRKPHGRPRRARGGRGAIALLVYTAVAFLERQYDVAIICGAMVGAIVGFLWYNAHPADIFMGDTGSLAIGGVLAAAAVLTKTELLLPVIGGLFVVEALSVIVQYAVFRLTGRKRRVFKWRPSTTTSRC